MPEEISGSILVDTAETWRALLAHWPGFVLTVDRDNRLTSLNRSTRLMDAHRDLGRDLFDFVPAEAQAELRERLAVARSGEGRVDWRTQARFDDGSSSWFSAHLVGLSDHGVLIVSEDVTADQETKLALERSERRFRAVIENDPAGISLTDAEGKFIYLSPAFERMSGYTPAERIGERPFEHVHPDDRALVEAAFQRVRATPSEEVTFTYRSMHRNGTYRWIETTGKNLLHDPSVGAIVGNFHDVTASRELADMRAAAAAAERASRDALQASEIAHRLLFEGSPVPLLVFDLETLELLAANAAASRLYGYAHDELMGMTLSDLRLRSDRESVKERLASLGDAEAVGLVVQRRKDGTSFTGELTSRVLDFGGRPARIGVMADVTARREAEEMRALLASIVQSSHDAIVSKRLDGTITSWNGAAELLFGYRADEAIGRSGLLVVPDERRGEDAALVERVVRGERVDHFETVRHRKDGTDVHVSLSFAPILDGAGKVVEVSQTGRDLTGRIEAAAALRRTEDQLRQAQKMEAVGRLAAGVAHDFNNVLSVILSYSDLLLGELNGADPMIGDLGEIRQAALRAAELTRQLLTFGRQNVVAPKVLDLNAVLVGLDRMLQRILGEDIELKTLTAFSLRPVFVDPTNIEQVVMNLVVNARDAMRSGGTLTLATDNVDLDDDFVRAQPGCKVGAYVVLSVTDTGTGMDAVTLTRIFEPFFTTKEIGKGTGLGLSTVFGIAQQAGGAVTASSEVGVGSTFRVYLPQAQAGVEVVGTPSPGATRRGTETILLVEDEEQVRTVAQGILERSGYRVLVAANPGEALLLGEPGGRAIHLLLTDVVMPQMNGAELARRLSDTRPDLKVLCMSGYTDDEILRRLVLDSSLAFLQKPFTPASLTRKVREVLDGVPRPS